MANPITPTPSVAAPAAPAPVTPAAVVTPAAAPVSPSPATPVAPAAEVKPVEAPVKAAEPVRSLLDETPAETPLTPAPDAKAPIDPSKAVEKSAETPVFELKDLKLPEGFKIDEIKDRPVLDILKGAKLPAAQAQSLIDKYATGIQEAVKQSSQAAQARVNQYFDNEQQLLQADPKLGMNNLETTKSNARKALNATLTRLSPELQEHAKAAIFGTKENNFNGVGKARWFVAFLNEIGASKFTEAKPISGDQSSSRQQKDTSARAIVDQRQSFGTNMLNALYPNRQK